MAITVKHSKVSAVADGPDTGLVRPSDWNADHTFTGTLDIANGGTGATTQQAAVNALAGAVTAAQFLRGNGTNVVMSAIQAADVPTLNQSTTGNAATATTLQTARNINGVSFNGSADITVADSTKLPTAGGTMTGTLTGKTSGSTTSASFDAVTTGGAYAAMWSRYAPFRTSVVHTGSSYAPSLSIYYEYTGVYNGHYSIGHLTTSAGNPGNLVIHHINGSSASQNTWSFDGANGGFTASGNVTAYSDERLKTDWAALPTDFIAKLAEVKHGTYTRTDSGIRQIGVSAQSLQPVAPEAVLDGEHLSVAYGNVALAACVELAKEVVALRAEIEELKRGV